MASQASHGQRIVLLIYFRLLTLPIQSLVTCIDAGEYMRVYNAIIVLKEILPVFPVASVVETTGPLIEITMEKFIEKEERGDLKILGRACVLPIS